MILLDTHVAVWMSTDKGQLSAPASDAIRASSKEGTAIAIASPTLWEVSMMSTRGDFRLPSTLSDYLRYLETAFVVLPISGPIAERSMQFSPAFSRDPTDHIIAATAIVHGLPLVTKDKRIRRSGEVTCIW